MGSHTLDIARFDFSPQHTLFSFSVCFFVLSSMQSERMMRHTEERWSTGLVSRSPRQLVLLSHLPPCVLNFYPNSLSLGISICDRVECIGTCMLPLGSIHLIASQNFQRK